MSPQRFSADGEPLAGTGLDDARFWLSILLRVLAIVGVVAFCLMLWRVAITPVSDSRTPNVIVSYASPSAATFPPELVSMAVAISTFIAPTPIPTPRPPTTPLPAPPPALICGPGVTDGTICEWGDFTPTPEPTMGPCLTPMPGFSCVWMGNVIATPVARLSEVR